MGCSIKNGLLCVKKILANCTGQAQSCTSLAWNEKFYLTLHTLFFQWKRKGPQAGAGMFDF